MGVVDGDGGLSGDGVEEVHPIGFGQEGSLQVDLKDAFYLSLANQGSGKIASKVFLVRKLSAMEIGLGCNVFNVDILARQHDLIEQAAVDADGSLQAAGLSEAKAGKMVEGAQVGIVDNDVGGIYIELGQGVVQQDVDGHPQIEAGGDGSIHIPQCGQAANLFLALVIQLSAVDGAAYDFCQRSEQLDLWGLRFAWLGQSHNQDTDGLGCGADGDDNASPSRPDSRGHGRMCMWIMGKVLNDVGFACLVHEAHNGLIGVRVFDVQVGLPSAGDY